MPIYENVTLIIKGNVELNIYPEDETPALEGTTWEIAAGGDDWDLAAGGTWDLAS